MSQCSICSKAKDLLSYRGASNETSSSRTPAPTIIVFPPCSARPYAWGCISNDRCAPSFCREILSVTIAQSFPRNLPREASVNDVHQMHHATIGEGIFANAQGVNVGIAYMNDFSQLGRTDDGRINEEEKQRIKVLKESCGCGNVECNV